MIRLFASLARSRLVKCYGQKWHVVLTFRRIVLSINRRLCVWDWIVAVTLVSDGRFLQLVLKSNQRKSKTFSVNMMMPTIFEVFIFLTACRCSTMGYTKRRWRSLRITAGYIESRLYPASAQRLEGSVQLVDVYGFVQKDDSVEAAFQQYLSVPYACDAFWGSVIVIAAENVGSCWRSAEGWGICGHFCVRLFGKHRPIRWSWTTSSM